MQLPSSRPSLAAGWLPWSRGRTHLASEPTTDRTRLHRTLLLCGGLAYLGWWGFVELALPGAFNPFFGRALVVACFFGVLVASHRSRRVAERLPDLLALCCAVATAHYFYLLERNHADPNWIVGSYITITAICAILQTARALLAYSLFVAALAIVWVLRVPTLSFVVFVPGTLTILLFAHFGLRSRLALLDRAVHELDARKQAEAALVFANRELESFSYSVAHDLRAPLRAIDGFSQIVLEECADRLDATAVGNLEHVRGEAQRMGALIDDLLQLARVGRGELARQKVDLSRLARQVVEQLRSQDPTHAPTVTIPDGIVVEADRQLLRILLENLLGNAWKFTSRTANAKIELSIEPTPRGTACVVRDNGAGFEMEFAGRLFTPFQRLHDASEFPGTGIGLATVQRIVERHGGQVWAEAKVAEGATFRFTLAPSSGGDRLGLPADERHTP